MNQGTKIKVRLFTYKSFRHYGGIREISTTSHICEALYVKTEPNGTNLVELVEECEGYRKGHYIAVTDTDFNLW